MYLQFRPFLRASQRVLVDLVFLQLLVVPQFLEYPELPCHHGVHKALWVPSLPSVQACQGGREVLSHQEIQVVPRARGDQVCLVAPGDLGVPPYHSLLASRSLLVFPEVLEVRALPAVPSHQLVLAAFNVK